MFLTVCPNRPVTNVIKLFFCEFLLKKGLYTCPIEVAGKFSFENKLLENSIYGHQIYNNMDNEKLEEFIVKRLNLLK